MITRPNNNKYLFTLLVFGLVNITISNILIGSPLIAEAGHNTIICSGAKVSITGDSATGGKKPYTYTWTNADGFMPGLQSTLLHPTTNVITASTIFYFTVTDSDLNTATDSFQVMVLPPSNFTGLPDTICSSASMSKLTAAAGVEITGSGIFFNGTFWYYNPQVSGPGTHIITSIGCDTTIKTTVVSPSPCIENIVRDTSGGSINTPLGIFTDCNGIIYLANNTNILSIDTFGITARIAGKPNENGYQDGKADSAKMNIPCGIVKTPDGIVYFVDNGNLSIRMIRNDSVITIAGSPPPGPSAKAYLDETGTNARFEAPYGLTYDVNRNCLYISESDVIPANNRIRKIDLNTGVNQYNVTTLLGGGTVLVTGVPINGMAAKLMQPKHISTDGKSLYIPDHYPSARDVYQYDLTDSTIVLYAGEPGVAGITDGPRLKATFIDPSGIATSCLGDVYITCEASFLRVIQNDTVATYSDPNHLINSPEAISTFVKGYLNIANTGNNNILRIPITNWNTGPWVGLDTSFSYCLGDPADTLNPIYKCGIYEGPGISMVGSKYIFTPPAAVGNYTISFNYTVSYCSEMIFKTIKVSANPKLSMTDSVAICSGNNALLDAGTGYIKYSWNTGQTTQTISVGMIGSYKVTVTDLNGCKGIDSTYVIASQKPIVEAGNNRNLCVGSTAIIGGTPTATGSAPFIYSWSPTLAINDTSISNPTVNPDSTIQYSVWVIDKFDCMAKDSITILSEPNPVANVGSLTYSTCVLKTVKIGTVAVNGLTYSWSPALLLSNSASASPYATLPTPVATYFILTVLDTASTCSAKDSTLVNVFANPVIDSVTNDSICIGTNVIMKGFVHTSSGSYTVLWSPSTGLSSDTIVNPVASPATTQNYKLVVSDGNGCSTRDSMWLYVSSLTVYAGNDTGLCPGQNTIIGGSPTAVGGLGTIFYIWSPDVGLNNITIANPTAIPVVPTIYKVIVSDQLGCIKQDSVLVTVFAKTIVNAGIQDTICQGNMTTIGGSPTASGGYNPYKYSWSPGINMNDSTISNPAVSVFALTKYFVHVTDSAGCSDTASVEIGVFALPIADAGPNDTVCQGLSKLIGGSPTAIGVDGPFTYLWTTDSSSLNNNKIANPIAKPNVTTLYRVIIDDTRNCMSYDSMILIVLQGAGIKFSDTVVCNHDSIQLIAQGGTNYQWSPTKWLNNPNIYNPIASPDSTITYMVIINSNLCGSDTTNVKINILPSPVITAWPDTVIFRGTEIQLHANGGVSYLWTPKEWIVDADTLQNPTILPLDSVVFVVMGKNSYGCSAYDSVKIKINGKINVFVPSAFTPGLKDGINDILKVETVGITNIHFWIYNRWGELVFEITDKSIGWDGTYQGVLQYPQTFGYILATEDFDGNKKTIKGTITLIQ